MWMRVKIKGFPTSTINVPNILKQKRQFLLGQAMDLSYLIWIVSLVVAKHNHLDSNLVGHMGFMS
jgi:hypothetical protein